LGRKLLTIGGKKGVVVEEAKITFTGPLVGWVTPGVGKYGRGGRKEKRFFKGVAGHKGLEKGTLGGGF